jgi:hypothetical protein
MMLSFKTVVLYFRSLVILSVLFSLTTVSAYAKPDENDVLTLSEAASFLRVEIQDLEKLAKKNLLPGRLVGTKWRFGKISLLNWLAKGEEQKNNAIPALELAKVSGRGLSLDLAKDSTSHSIEDKKIPVEKDPSDKKSADVFLRNENITLKKKELSIEFGGLYSYGDHQDIFSSTQRETLTSVVGIRYGLAKNLQLFSSMPYVYSRNNENSFGEVTSADNSRWGDVTIGLQRSILKEGLWVPEIIVSITGKIPTVDGNRYAFGPDVSFIKSLDPVAIFFNVGYNHLFNSNNQTVIPEQKNYYTTTFGYAFALNDLLTIGTSVSGLFPQYPISEDEPLIQKQFSLKLSLTSRLSRSLYVEPSVSIGLNRAASDVTFGMNFVYNTSSL